MGNENLIKNTKVKLKTADIFISSMKEGVQTATDSAITSGLKDWTTDESSKYNSYDIENFTSFEKKNNKNAKFLTKNDSKFFT